MLELEQLQQRDIPAGRQVLRDHHCNLHRVADYCESNYLQASDKQKALEETMALSTQSLASVTYQVSSLATAFLRLLDLQAAELRKVEADVGCVAQRVDMHKEKVSRREIGSLTVMVTLYPYTRQKDNELSFQPGTLLFVTRRYSDGWCEGVMGEEAGFFPGNYVEPF
ncbi:ABI gene family member 3 [Athene cunicularia]|uniref:ABI gene family member 3 n=1 Tax=Athene cunicularia TaxID=194338 RepID=UPI000EF73A85|nr:ABI gene family member 3 [Athene cunicularia]